MTTLETFFANDGSMATTCKQIFTHRHTIRYRLERVRELTGLDVNSSDGRERLGLGPQGDAGTGCARAERAGVRAGRGERGRVPKPPTDVDARRR